MTGDVSPAEIRFDFAAFDGGKRERSVVAFCHGGFSLLAGHGTPIVKVFPPFLYPLRAISGLAGD